MRVSLIALLLNSRRHSLTILISFWRGLRSEWLMSKRERLKKGLRNSRKHTSWRKMLSCLAFLDMHTRMLEISEKRKGYSKNWKNYQNEYMFPPLVLD